MVLETWKKMKLVKILHQAFVTVWAVSWEKMSLGHMRIEKGRPRSACVSTQADQHLRCPQTESLDTIECFKGSKCPDETLRMCRTVWIRTFCACLKARFRLTRTMYWYSILKMCLGVYAVGKGPDWLAELFICVEVLRPSQSNGVMSSAISLPNHTFIGQA